MKITIAQLKPFVKPLIFTAFFSFISSSVYANPLFFNRQSAAGPAILTITTITGGVEYLPLDSVSVYVGTSKSSPCSDINLLGTDYHISAIEGSSSISSDDIVNLETTSKFHAAPGSVTCLKTDSVYKGKTYSTGNIQLIWDGKQYVKANPSSVTIDFTK